MAGDPVAVTDGGNTTVSFDLAQGGSIAGTVTGQGAGPLDGVTVKLLLPNGSPAVEMQTPASGEFSFGQLPSGTYFLITANDPDWVHEIFNNLQCPASCSAFLAVTQGAGIVVTAPAAVTGRDFELSAAGGISGTATDQALAPLTPFSVGLYNAAGLSLAFTNTDLSGAYAFVSVLPGTYRVATAAGGAFDHLNQVWQGSAPCLGACVAAEVAAGTPVVVSAGATTGGVNFVLAEGGTISGVLTEEGTGDPLVGAGVTVHTSSRQNAVSTSTNASGEYTIHQLPTGNYYLTTNDSSGDWVNEVHDNIQCLGTCTGAFAAAQGAAIAVTAPADTGGRNFVLSPGGGVSGTVTSATTSNPLSQVTVTLSSAAGATLTIASTNVAGVYAIGGLPPGSYRLSTLVHTGSHGSEVWDNLPCAASVCTAAEIAAGTPVAVTAGAVVTGRDFALPQGGGISGMVTTQGPGTPIVSAPILVYTQAGALAAATTTDGSGQYTVANLPAGSYYVFTSVAAGTINEVYNNVQCPASCVTVLLAQGTLIPVAAGTTVPGINFALEPTGGISGTVINASTLQPIPFATVSLYSAAGASAGGGITNASGVYTITGLKNGTYYLAAGVTGYIAEIYDDVPCPSLCTGAAAAQLGTPVVVTAPATTTGRDFALTTGATISGTVTGDGGPLVGVLVFAVAPAGNLGGIGITGIEGTYSVAGLPPGAYYVLTSNNLGYFNEVHQDILCPGACATDEILTGTPVVVASGGTATVDFDLPKAGAISGQVTSAATGDGIPALMHVIDATGTQVAIGFSDGSGNYFATPLLPGTYYLFVTSPLHQNEYFDDVPCNGVCEPQLAPSRGTPIVVAAGATTSGKNLALAPASQVTGTVTSASGTPLEETQVTAYFPSGEEAARATTDELGQYQLDGLAVGTYRIAASAAGYLEEVWDNIPCGAECSPVEIASGTPIAIAAVETVTGRDFVLDPGATITGTVTDAATGEAVAGVVIYLLGSDGSFTDDLSDETGAFTFDSLVAGDYALLTDEAEEVGYFNEIFDNLACPEITCSFAVARQSGTKVTLAAGGSATADFALVEGARITGTVTDAATGEPVEGVVVYALGSGGLLIDGFSDEAGTFTIGGLAAGDYALVTDEAEEVGYLNEIFDNLACPEITCSFALARQSGTKVTVAAGGSATADFALVEGGRISGTVTDAGSGAPLQGVAVRATRAVGGGSELTLKYFSGADGRYSVIGLPAGTYYALTDNELGYFNEIHPDLPCKGDCDSAFAREAGTPLAVATAATVPGIDFALAQGGRISGRVTDAGTGSGVAEVLVTIVDPLGNEVSEATTDEAGNYLTGAGIAAGSVHAIARPFSDLVSEIFDNLPCTGDCFARASTGTAIAVTVGVTTTGRDFALEHGGTIGGRVTSEATGLGVEEAFISIFDAAGRQVDTAFAGVDGTYTSDGLPAGTYYAFIDEAPGLAPEIFSNLPCAAICQPSRVTGGAPIAATPGVTTPGIDFVLAAAGGAPGVPSDLAANPATGGGVLLTWDAPDTGGPATGYALDAGFEPGATALTLPVAGTQHLVPSVPPGRYFVRVRATNAAGSSAASEEIEIVVGAGGAMAPGTPGPITTLMIGRRLVATWSGPFDGGPVTDFVVEAGTASGLADIGAIPVTVRRFEFDPVPDGVYYLRVRARNAAGVSAPTDEVMLVVGGAASPPQAPRSPAATVSGSTVNLSWFAPPNGLSGPVTGYILEAGSAPGLSNLVVAPLGPGTMLSVSDVPAGTYYVRLRAVNALGVSAVSGEIIVVVQ